jgi:hypothetical protein
MRWLYVSSSQSPSFVTASWLASTIVQVIVGGGIVFAIGVGLGRIGAG